MWGRLLILVPITRYTEAIEDGCLTISFFFFFPPFFFVAERIFIIVLYKKWRRLSIYLLWVFVFFPFRLCSVFSTSTFLFPVRHSCS